MSKQRGLGSLADLAKILEEASDPESDHREDRREVKPKAAPTRKGAVKQIKVLDPKRKLWYEKRLREQAEAAHTVAVEDSKGADRPHTPELTKAAATRVGASLLETLANAAKEAKDAKAKSEGKGRTEAWRRKPGDPIF
jgi:hypothetical protein